MQFVQATQTLNKILYREKSLAWKFLEGKGEQWLEGAIECHSLSLSSFWLSFSLLHIYIGLWSSTIFVCTSKMSIF